ncbi:unnamed protein product, partial [Haemonchus placei]|uniref:F-box protein 34 n=1 Tax=Haemonchus placei TaxID=6290 RepID=A0A0N4WW17_HAEPC
ELKSDGQKLSFLPSLLRVKQCFQAVAAAKKETPVAVRTRRHFQNELHMSSPSDAQLSPCTVKLFGKGGRKMTSGPTAILRSKQHSAIPFNMND